ncbi:uncharacterized protein isoform X2 [Rhodnius prolixus]|uniref:uncharacterized protein isoform X2 n=1 Tax=Rhodnius prolixus TaxID=13249 RepID=UPI003D18E8F3
MISDLQYPEIANLVSWKGDIMSNASDSVLLENELPEINEDNEGPRVNEFSQNGFNQDIVSGQLLDDYEATNDGEKVKEEENVKTKLLWPTTDSSQTLTNKAIQGVGPLKFALEENDNGANNNQPYESAQISSAPVTPKHGKLSSWRNNYYSNKMSALENEYKESEEKRINDKHHFSNFGTSRNQESNINSGHEQNSWISRESEYFDINNNNNANWLGKKQSPQRSLLVKQRKPDAATSTFARYRTKINPKEISIGSIKNKQYLKYFNYDLNNSPVMKSDNDMKLQRQQNEEIRNAQRYFNGNSIQNYHLRNHLVNWPPNTNIKQPSLERKDNANTDIRSNTDNKDISDSSVIDESQRARANSRALDIQEANNEDIVKEALELTHEDKIEDPPTQRAPSNLEKYNTMQKLITLDTSRKQSPENQFDIESQTKFLHPREKYYGNKFNRYPSTYQAPYEIQNRINAPNYERQLNNVEVNTNNNPHPPNLDGRPPDYQWTDFGNNENHRKLETNRFSYENYDQRNKKFQEQDVNSENLEQGISQQENYDLSQQYGQEQPNDFPVANVDKCNGNAVKSCQRKQWQAKNATKEESIFDISNIYVDKHVIPHKKPRQGRSHPVRSNQGRSNNFLNDQGKSNVAANKEGRSNILASNLGRSIVPVSNKKKSNVLLNCQRRNNVAANSKEKSNVAAKNIPGRKRVMVQENRVLVPSIVKTKENFKSASGGLKLAATGRIPTVQCYAATVFSVPTPMAMLPANAVQSNQEHYSRPANVTTPPPLNPQCLVSVGTINSNLKVNDVDKFHKAVPSYINNSNKLNVIADEKAELLPTTINTLEATTTEFKNMLMAEAISVINSNVDGKDSTANDGQSIRADPTKHLYNSNSMNNVLDTSNQYDYNSSALHNTNSTSYNQNIDNFESNDTLNAQEEKVSEQQISPMDSQLETKSLVLKNGPSYNAPDQNATVSGTLSQMIVSSNQSAGETPSKSDQKIQSDSKSVDKKKLEVSKAKSNNNNLSANISSADISATTGVSISNENNDERIQDLIPSSQWTDMYYDDRNRRGIECGCFPANEECDKTVYSDESDQSNFYSLMNKHNPKAMMIRAYNNWVAERENRALSKTNKTRIQDKVVKQIHEEDQEEEEENANIGEDMHSYGEGELRPMRFDDPELAFIRHHDSSPSRNAQVVDVESGYDEDEQSEGVPLITHAPVKYGKLRNLTNGAFGGLAKQKSWLNRVNKDNSK